MVPQQADDSARLFRISIERKRKLNRGRHFDLDSNQFPRPLSILYFFIHWNTFYKTNESRVDLNGICSEITQVVWNLTKSYSFEYGSISEEKKKEAEKRVRWEGADLGLKREKIKREKMRL